MHFEILVEDRSGKIALEYLLERILGPEGLEHTFRIHAYKGIGRLPKKRQGVTSPQKRILLDRLPGLLRGYGKSLQHISAAVVVVVDLDTKNCVSFKQELLETLNNCNPKPSTLFRIAIEEGEAWLFGDLPAITTAYPDAKKQVLNSYKQDSVCGTWERLADAIYPGGSHKLKQLGWPYTGIAKCEWAKNISPHINVDTNKSKSFQVFRDGVRQLANADS
ncbi:MAG TPA: DUF4276 family protein [Desulfocapsa sulfexigens]|nr:DUF4276 family protein [Desulfocapsa sulfexigens]